MMGVNRSTMHFKIGVVRASLYSSLGPIADQYASLYRRYRLEHAHDDEIRVEVRPQARRLGHRRRFEVTVNGRVHAESVSCEEVLPEVEWAFAWEIPETLPQYLHLHSSAMEVNGIGVILPGDSGSGKSTLTAGLLTRGWRYLCDEFALIHADTFEVHPYPRAICLKRASYPVVESLGLRLHGRHRYFKRVKGPVGFVDPTAVREDAIGRACPIRFVIFPKYMAGAKPRLIPISQAEAALALHHVCYNLSTCRRLGVDVLTGMIRGAQSYRLIGGEIQATCNLLQQLVENEKTSE